jgi:hypothetical protein
MVNLNLGIKILLKDANLAKLKEWFAPQGKRRGGKKENRKFLH